MVDRVNQAAEVHEAGELNPALCDTDEAGFSLACQRLLGTGPRSA